MIRDLVLKNRSYRRFHQDTAIELDTLRELVDLARLSASGGNVQALKFVLCNDPETNAQIFSNITLAGNPSEEEAPTAYIIILGDKKISKSVGCDHGIAAQSILLGATEKGLGGCMIGLINRERLGKVLGLVSHYDILLVLAIGKPKETVVIETAGKPKETVVVETSGQAEDTQRWWDDKGVLHVPKRPLGDIIISEISTELAGK